MSFLRGYFPPVDAVRLYEVQWWGPMPNQFAVAGLEVPESLRKQRIRFKVSSRGPTRRRIYVIENYPFLETELAALLEAGRLHPAGIEQLRGQIESNRPDRKVPPVCV